MQNILVAQARDTLRAIVLRALLTVLAAWSLASCGGGGVDVPTASAGTAPVFGGTIVGRSDPSFILVTRGDGTSYLFYGPDLASASLVTGYIFMHGGSASYPGDHRLYNASDPAQGFGYGASLDLRIDPSAPAVAGTLHYRDQAATYELTGGPVPGSSYRNDRPANIGDAVGTWNLSDLQANSASLTVSQDSGISGTYQGCTLTGTLRPTAHGVNQMDLQATLADCPTTKTGTLSLPYIGFAVAFPVTAGGTQLLIFAMAFDENTWDSDRIIAIGRR
jgi:hypothetical protein